jgi:hypothetical protein
MLMLNEVVRMSHHLGVLNKTYRLLFHSVG